MAHLSSSALASKAATMKNKGLIEKAYEWDKEEVSSNDNEMVKVKVFMALAEDNDDVSKEGVRNGEWVKISMRKVHTLLEMEDNDDRKTYLDYLCIDLNYVEEQRINLLTKHRNLVQELNTCKEQLLVLKQVKLDFLTMQHVNTKILKENQNLRKELKELTAITETWLNSSNKVNHYISEQIPTQKKRIMGVDQLTGDPSSSRKKDLVLVKSSADDTKVSIPGVEIPWLYKAEGFILPNHDTEDESSVCSTPLPLLGKLTGPAKITKKASALKINPAPAEKLKHVKTKDDFSLSIVMKELNDLKLQINKNQSSYSRDNNSQQVPSNAFQNKYKTQFKRKCELCGLNNHLSENCYKVVVIVKLHLSASRLMFFIAKATDNLNWIWNKILTHLNFKTINKLAKQNLVIGLPLLVYSKDKPCSSCEKGKHHRGNFKTKQTFSIKHLLYIDLFGPVTPRSINHEKYTLVIVDEYSSILVNFCDEKGITQNFSSPYTPEQNGVAERKNRTLIEAARTMLSGSVFSKQYWTEARIPNINFLHVFGCPVYIHNHEDHLEKFGEKGWMKLTTSTLLKQKDIHWTNIFILMSPLKGAGMLTRAMAKELSTALAMKAFTSALTQYVEYLVEFWYTAIALENSRIWVSTPTRGDRGEIGVTTFRNDIGAYYSNEYVDSPSLAIVKPWFAEIGYNGDIGVKGTLKKNGPSLQGGDLMDGAN
ncbi:retrovirus-related pol polyprotein from transposon TNT 1-94 [Tanacetum coccineum]